MANAWPACSAGRSGRRRNRGVHGADLIQSLGYQLILAVPPPEPLTHAEGDYHRHYEEPGRLNHDDGQPGRSEVPATLAPRRPLLSSLPIRGSPLHTHLHAHTRPHGHVEKRGHERHQRNRANYGHDFPLLPLLGRTVSLFLPSKKSKQRPTDQPASFNYNNNDLIYNKFALLASSAARIDNFFNTIYNKSITFFMFDIKKVLL